MRIRRSAARLLGSAYPAPAAPPPDPTAPSELPTTPLPCYLGPCSPPESRAVGGFVTPVTAPGEPCELNRSPWDLIAELSISDSQVEEDLVDKYFVSVPCRASWLFTGSITPVASAKDKQAVGAGTVNGDSTSQSRHEVLKKAPKKLALSKEKESERKKTAKVKKEEQEVKQPTYKCKKNDGKKWHCHRPVSRPNSLCDYHFYQKRAYLNPDFADLVSAEADADAEMEVPQPAPASKQATSSKPRKKKPGHDLGATEGFYYYAGFGSYRSKRQCRSTNESAPSVHPKKQEEDEPPAEGGSNQQARAAADGPSNKAPAHDDTSSCDDIAGIAGGDEESSDDDYMIRVSGRNMNDNGEHRDGKRKNGWKRWRKPVKARSLKSLMT